MYLFLFFCIPFETNSLHFGGTHSPSLPTLAKLRPSLATPYPAVIPSFYDSPLPSVRWVFARRARRAP